MSHSPGRRLAYATWGYTNHDLRFVQLAVDAGWSVHYFRFDGGSSSLDSQPLPEGAFNETWLGSHHAYRFSEHERFVNSFRQSLLRLSPSLVHAGPVPTVSSVAVDAEASPVISMSWASDLLVDTKESAEAEQNAARALKGSAAIIVDCSEVMRRAVDLGGDPAKIVSFPWGVELDRFPFVPPRENNSEVLHLLSLRSLHPIYDVDVIIQALAHVRSTEPQMRFHLTLAGSGPLENDLRNSVERLNLSDHVTWLGRIPESEVQRHLASCDIHVSAARCDGSSLSLLQAMATGRPSITTDIPCNRDWVTNGESGWLFPVGDHRALAEVIIKAHGLTPAFRHIMGQRATSVAESRANWLANSVIVPDLYRKVYSEGLDRNTLGPRMAKPARSKTEQSEQ